ncbi:MAG TPA: hypothetical protein ENL16_03525 [Candidatus Woesearchaeota archaeon]|nr:hypothetical protein [Candidatus Woesearchaeota archaeon]
MRLGITPQISKANCEVCEEVITQPVCPACLEREMIEWLVQKEKDEDKAGLIDFIKKTTISLRGHGYAQTKCVICGKNMRVCAHCYCKEILDYINKEYPELEEEFITHFDFNIHFKPRMI